MIHFLQPEAGSPYWLHPVGASSLKLNTNSSASIQSLKSHIHGVEVGWKVLSHD
jgi:hypothetical protein